MNELEDFDLMNSKNELVTTFKQSGISLYIKREDLLLPEISGNKFRKLKYNLIEAQQDSVKTLLTFGGAYSNHIAAVAAAGKKYEYDTIGIIRGDELERDLENTLRDNPTLNYAVANGMQLHFVSREEYRQKDNREYLDKLEAKFGQFYLLPEGGTNSLAIKGCEEILTVDDNEFDYICCAVGTGGTISGIINSSSDTHKILGFPALKGAFLKEEIQKLTIKNNWSLIYDYHFGGYAKVQPKLVEFINKFKMEFNIALDPIYTGKMLYGIFEMIENSAFPQNSRILAIHTGGLQGIAGMNTLLAKKNFPLIDV